MTALSPAPAIVAVPADHQVVAVPSNSSSGSTAFMMPDEAREMVERDDAGKWDFSVLRRDLLMRNGEIEFPLDLGGEEPIRERLAPTTYAFGQICSRLGLPVSYMRMCPLSLRDHNLNHWFEQGSLARQTRQEWPTGARFAPIPDDFWDETPPPVPTPPKSQKSFQPDDEKWLLRARHGTLRAALSSSYSPLDNAALLDVLLPTLPERYRVQWMGLQDESFHLRMVDTGAARTVLPNDEFFVGIHIVNSEIGLRSVTVNALAYRLVCSNGLIALVKSKSLFRGRHIHIAVPRFKAALEEALAHAIGATDNLLANLQRVSKVQVHDPENAIDSFAKFWQQTEKTAEIAKATLQSEPASMQYTAYGIINAFTRAAQSLPDEKRYELEMHAGQLAQEADFASALSKAERVIARGAEPDVVSYARRIFDAEVVSRRGGHS